ncbi:RDD family protein [Rhizobium sp. CC-YZS058]|uniref:RDD family protein n=1 Tax=Rhizobium sp. CC-YZS058 TaxID=3042153 RepID=UPI002B0584D8|nr:RDD family protein [Rhizobium sp. CC-YZS058]MEA3535812.1 RDD family protein [Rhizobium sp. CC-YZS058]
MDEATGASGAGEMVLKGKPERHFFRRGLAFLIDGFVLNIAAQLILSVLTIITPLFFGGENLPPSSTNCPPELLNELNKRMDQEAPLQGSEMPRTFACATNEPLDQPSATPSPQTQNGLGRAGESNSVQIDESGRASPEAAQPNSIVVGSVFLLVLGTLAFAALVILSANGRRTPGKRLMRLRILQLDGTPPGIRRNAKREILKFAPFIASTLYMLIMTAAIAWDGDYWFQLRMMQAFWDAGPTIVPPILLPAVVLFIVGHIWWLLPFLFWRGQTFYDRIAGCVLIKAPEPGKAG